MSLGRCPPSVERPRLPPANVPVPSTGSTSVENLLGSVLAVSSAPMPVGALFLDLSLYHWQKSEAQALRLLPTDQSSSNWRLSVSVSHGKREANLALPLHSEVTAVAQPDLGRSPRTAASHPSSIKSPSLKSAASASPSSPAVASSPPTLPILVKLNQVRQHLAQCSVQHLPSSVCVAVAAVLIHLFLLKFLFINEIIINPLSLDKKYNSQNH